MNFYHTLASWLNAHADEVVFWGIVTMVAVSVAHGWVSLP